MNIIMQDFDNNNIFPLHHVLKKMNEHKIHEDKMHQTIEIERFRHNGTPIVLFSDNKYYENPKTDTVIESVERHMMPQEVFDQFYEKINPQPFKAKSHNKTEKKRKGNAKGKSKKANVKN